MEVLLLILYLMYLPLSLYTFKLLKKKEDTINPNATSELCLKWIMGITSTFGYVILGYLPDIMLIGSLIRLACFGFTVYVISPDTKGQNVMYMMFGKWMIKLNFWLKKSNSLLFLILMQILICIAKLILDTNSFKIDQIRVINKEVSKFYFSTKKVMDTDEKLKKIRDSKTLNVAPHISESFVVNKAIKSSLKK